MSHCLEAELVFCSTETGIASATWTKILETGTISPIEVIKGQQDSEWGGSWSGKASFQQKKKSHKTEELFSCTRHSVQSMKRRLDVSFFFFFFDWFHKRQSWGNPFSQLPRWWAGAQGVVQKCLKSCRTFCLRDLRSWRTQSMHTVPVCLWGSVRVQTLSHHEPVAWMYAMQTGWLLYASGSLTVLLRKPHSVCDSQSHPRRIFDEFRIDVDS